MYPQVRDVSGMYATLAEDAYGSPKDILPRQAADIVAYEIKRNGSAKRVAAHRTCVGH
jgi:hypothetical protein